MSGKSADVLHGANPRRGKRSPLGLEMADHVLNAIALFTVEPYRVNAVDAGDQIGTLAEVGVALIAPLDPFVITVAGFYGTIFLPVRCGERFGRSATNASSKRTADSGRLPKNLAHHGRIY